MQRESPRGSGYFDNLATGNKIIALALNTYREGVRDRVFAILGIFAVIVFVSTFIIGPLSLGEQERISKDVGLAAISLLGLAVAVLVGTGIIFREIEKRTIYTIVTKPVKSWHFIFGKFVGLNAIVGLLVVLMTILLLIVSLIVSKSFDPWILVAIVLSWLELVLLTAVSILMSTICAPILGAIITCLLFLIGHTSAAIKQLAASFGSSSIKLISTIIYYVIPNLEYLNVRSKVIHGVPIEASYIAFASAYAFLYTIAFLILASFSMSRKEYR